MLKRREHIPNSLRETLDKIDKQLEGTGFEAYDASYLNDPNDFSMVIGIIIGKRITQTEYENIVNKGNNT